MRKWAAWLVLVGLLVSGCQLAISEGAKSETVPSTGDAVAGILVTTESITDPTEETSIHSLASRGKRLYAELIQQEDGSVSFQFDEGMAAMGYYVSEQTDADGGYWASEIDQGIHPNTFQFSTVNQDSFVTLETEIYVSDTAEELMLYFSPIYQQADGSVYALGTASAGMHAVSMYDCSVTFRSEITAEAMENSGSAKATIRVINLPETYRILQMDKNYQILTAKEFAPRELPPKFTPESGAAFLILEICSEDEVLERFVYSPDDMENLLDVFYPLESGICCKGYTQILWEGSE